MGESREGEGRSEAPTTSSIAAALAVQYSNDGRTLDAIRVDYATDGLYTVQVFVRGESEPESFFLRVRGPEPQEGPPPPLGRPQEADEGRPT